MCSSDLAVDQGVAEAVCQQFVEVLMAPHFTEQALAVLATRSRLLALMPPFATLGAGVVASFLEQAQVARDNTSTQVHFIHGANGFFIELSMFLIQSFGISNF